MSVALSDSARGVPLTVEFYPAFARLPAHAWRADARIRFLGPDEPVGQGGALSIVAGGTRVVGLPNAPLLGRPEGVAPPNEKRVTTRTATLCARRTGFAG